MTLSGLWGGGASAVAVASGGGDGGVGSIVGGGESCDLRKYIPGRILACSHTLSLSLLLSCFFMGDKVNKLYYSKFRVRSQTRIFSLSLL